MGGAPRTVPQKGQPVQFPGNCSHTTGCEKHSHSHTRARAHAHTHARTRAPFHLPLLCSLPAYATPTLTAKNFVKVPVLREPPDRAPAPPPPPPPVLVPDHPVPPACVGELRLEARDRGLEVRVGELAAAPEQPLDQVALDRGSGPEVEVRVGTATMCVGMAARDICNGVEVMGHARGEA